MEEKEKDVQRTGIVKFYIDEKLFGFITDDKTGDEIYVHVSGLIDEIRKNSVVTYTQTSIKGKEQAIEVRTKRF